MCDLECFSKIQSHVYTVGREYPKPYIHSELSSLYDTSRELLIISVNKVQPSFFEQSDVAYLKGICCSFMNSWVDCCLKFIFIIGAISRVHA